MSVIQRSVDSVLDWLYGSDRARGNTVRVNSVTMLGSAAVWYGINTIAGDLGKMPLDIKRRLPGGGSETLTTDPRWKLLREESNSYQTADVFKEQIQGQMLGWGNGRSVILQEASRPVELIPMQPDRSWTCMVMGEKFHVTNPLEDDPVKFAEGIQQLVEDPRTVPSNYYVFADRDVLHVQGYGLSGWSGLSVAGMLADVIGTDLQAQRYARNGMRKGFSGQILLNDSNNIFKNEDDAKKFLEAFRKEMTNEEKQEAIGMLRQGMTAEVMNMSNRDAQFLDQRKLSRQDIMLIFGLQHIPGDDSSVSYNSLEQKQLAYLASCLDRWLCRWELQCNMKLRTEAEKRAQQIYFKFNRRSWIATDAATTQQIFSGYIASEVYSPDEVRAKLDENPRPDGRGGEYGNPAINPQQSTEQLAYMLGVERNRVLAACDHKDGDFVGWLDKFYAKWHHTVIDALAKCCDLETITDTFAGHKDELLEAAGKAHNTDELKTLVTEVVDKWIA